MRPQILPGYHALLFQAGATAANAVSRWAGSRPNSLNLRSPGPFARRGVASASLPPEARDSRKPARQAEAGPGAQLALGCWFGPDASSNPFRRQPSNGAQPHPPPGNQARARSREAGPQNQWAPRAEWKGLSDPHDVTKPAGSAPLFRSHEPGSGQLSSSPPTRHCAANRKAGRAPARKCGRGSVAALRGRVAEWAGLGQGAELRGVAPGCVEGPPGGAAAAAASLLRRSGSSPAVPGSYSLLRAPSRPFRNPPPPSQSCEGAAGALGERRPRACGGTNPGAPGAREGVGAAAGVAALGAAAGSGWWAGPPRPLSAPGAPWGPAGGWAPGRCDAGGAASLPEGFPLHTSSPG